MRYLLSIFLLFIFAVSASAQDQLYTTDGKKEEVKVLEIRPNEIRYKKASNPDGPDYVIPKSDVLLITYANGTHESFAEYRKPQRQQQYYEYDPGYGTYPVAKKEKPFDSLTVNWHKNLICYNTIDLINTNISFSYERFGPQGKMGVRIPVTIGFGHNNDFYVGSTENIGQGTVFATGIDINFYPGGQGRARYYIAPSFLVKGFKYLYFDSFWDANLGSWMTVSEQRLGLRYVGLVKHGLLVQISENFNMNFAVGLGIRKNKTEYSDNTKTYANFEFNVGYRF